MTSVLESGFRDDLTEAHRATIAAVGRAGAWWSGPERCAIALEVRRASVHADLPPWQAPSSIDGMIGEDHLLPAGPVRRSPVKRNSVEQCHEPLGPDR